MDQYNLFELGIILLFGLAGGLLIYGQPGRGACSWLGGCSAGLSVGCVWIVRIRFVPITPMISYVTMASWGRRLP